MDLYKMVVVKSRRKRRIKGAKTQSKKGATHPRNPPPTRQPAIPRKRKHLPRGRGIKIDIRNRQQHQKQSRQRIHPRPSHHPLKHVQKRIAAGIRNRSLHIIDREQETHEENHSQHAIDGIRPEYRARNTEPGVRDLFAEMRGRVGRQRAEDGADLADHDAQSRGGPPAAVVEDRENGARGRVWRECPEADDHGQEEREVEGEREVLCRGQRAPAPDVGHQQHEHGAEDEQRALPARGLVVRVIDRDEALDDGSGQEGA